MMIDRLEPRLQFATVSGFIFNDTDGSKTFDSNESAMRGTTVFIDANANGVFDNGEQSTVADKRGKYTFTGLAAGDYEIGTTLSSTDFKSTVATVNGTVQGRFNIEYRNIDPAASPVIKAALITAAQRWEQVITGDLPDVPQRDGSVVDDLVLDVHIAPIDGPSGILAYAGPSAIRSDYLAYRGDVTIDADDATNSGLVDIITHEIGHALGLGTAWVAQQLITGRNSKSPRYIGENAVREYDRLFKTNNLSVPIENTFSSGTRESHWKEDVLHEELMTGFIEPAGTLMPLSAITVGQFQDLGYEVNYNAADEWNPATHVVTKTTALDIGGVANERKLTVSSTDAISDLSFGFTAKSAPVIRSFTITPSPVAAGTNITLSAAAITDADGDTLSGVSFWKESNGIEGLQKDSDTPIGVRTYTKNRAYSIQTSTTNLLGDQQYYAVATDSTGYSGRRTGVVNVQSVTAPTEPPTNLAVRQRASSVIRFAFADNVNVGLTGYRIEVATSPSFGKTSLVDVLNISGDTFGATFGDLRPGITYYIHVRAYNLAGASPYSPALPFETV
ncbi:MAG: Parallel beta-helix repeat protein [Phycisphaerales bacterium]|nr:Parallel beta-helix repeat protein [Phycisphaerales bacterium]